MRVGAVDSCSRPPWRFPLRASSARAPPAAATFVESENWTAATFVESENLDKIWIPAKPTGADQGISGASCCEVGSQSRACRTARVGTRRWSTAARSNAWLLGRPGRATTGAGALSSIASDCASGEGWGSTCSASCCDTRDTAVCRPECAKASARQARRKRARVRGQEINGAAKQNAQFAPLCATLCACRVILA